MLNTLHIVNAISHYQFNLGLWFLIPDINIIKRFEETIVSMDPRNFPNLQVCD